MATTVKEVSTVDVLLVDEGNYDYTFKLDNPVENLSLSKIRETLNPYLNTKILSNRGYPFIRVAGATLATSRKVVLEDYGVNIYVTPESLSLTQTYDGTVEDQNVFTVTNDTVKGAFLMNGKGDKANIRVSLDYDSSTVSILVSKDEIWAESEKSVSYDVCIVTTLGAQIVAPVTVTLTA